MQVFVASKASLFEARAIDITPFEIEWITNEVNCYFDELDNEL